MARSAFQKIDDFHQTKKGKLVFGVIELALAYLLVSRAIHTGSLWQYFFFALLAVGGMNNLVRAFWSKPNGTKRKKR